MKKTIWLGIAVGTAVAGLVIVLGFVSLGLYSIYNTVLREPDNFEKGMADFEKGMAAFREHQQSQDWMQETNDNLQRQIDELKCELEELKRKE